MLQFFVSADCPQMWIHNPEIVHSIGLLEGIKGLPNLVIGDDEVVGPNRLRVNHENNLVKIILDQGQVVQKPWQVIRSRVILG